MNANEAKILVNEWHQQREKEEILRQEAIAHQQATYEVELPELQEKLYLELMEKIKNAATNGGRQIYWNVSSNSKTSIAEWQIKAVKTIIPKFEKEGFTVKSSTPIGTSIFNALGMYQNNFQITISW